MVVSAHPRWWTWPVRSDTTGCRPQGRGRGRGLAAPRREPRPPEVLPGCVPAHGRGDADARGADPGGGPSAPRTWPPTGSCTRRCASPPSCTWPEALTLEQVVSAVLEGFPAGQRRTRVSPCMRCSPRCGPPRALAGDRRGSRSGTGTRAWSGSTSPAPRRAARRPGTWTRSSTWPGRTSTSPSTPGKVSGCRPSGRHSNGAGAERLGHGVRIVDDIRITADGTAQLGRLASYVRDRRTPLEMCPSSNVQTGRGPRPSRPTRSGLLRQLSFRVTVNTDNRLMSGVSLVVGVRACSARRSGTAGPTSNGSRSTR